MPAPNALDFESPRPVPGAYLLDGKDRLLGRADLQSFDAREQLRALLGE